MNGPRLPDPMQLCRELLNKLEHGVNEFAARKMESREFAQALTCYVRASTGARYLAERSLASLLEHLDLPSRSEVQELAVAVQRIEDKLDSLLPDADAQCLVPRPPRGRRPLELQPEVALAKARARAAKPRAPRPKRSR
ncbi:hypothetical protein [Pseudomonas nicosulfuronedens]